MLQLLIVVVALYFKKNTSESYRLESNIYGGEAEQLIYTTFSGMNVKNKTFVPFLVLRDAFDLSNCTRPESEFGVTLTMNYFSLSLCEFLGWRHRSEEQHSKRAMNVVDTKKKHISRYLANAQNVTQLYKKH